MYVRGLTFKEAKVSGPLGEGAEVYTAACSGCHGADGEGGVGYEFAGGEVLKTFPHIEDQLRFVYSGSRRLRRTQGIAVYGNPERDAAPQHPREGSDARPGPDRRRWSHRGTDPRRRLPRAVHARRRRSDGGLPRGVREVVQPRGPRLGRPRGRVDHVRQRRRQLEGTFVGRHRRRPRVTLPTRSPDRRLLPAPRRSRRRRPDRRRWSGGGAAAAWLASRGHDVVVVERRVFPRSKACGDVLTPRAVRQLQDLGLDRRTVRVAPTGRRPARARRS